MPAIPVGILGATGMVGQQFIALLADHPWFKVAYLGASERSAGKAFKDAAAWRLPNRLPDDVANRVVEAAAPGTAPKLVFSGLDSSVAGEIEAAFAMAGHIVVSNSRNYRMFDTVPLMIPEVNAEHLEAARRRRVPRRDGRGASSPIPTAPTVVLAMALAPLRQFGLTSTIVTTLQAISGAGYPGVPSWDILGNVIPHIGGGEEEKIETETKKILGTLAGGEDGRSSRAPQRDDDPRARAERTHRLDVGRSRAEADAGRDHRRVAVVPRSSAGTGPAVGATAAGRSTSMK